MHHFQHKQSSPGLFSFHLFISKLLNMSPKTGTSHIVESVDIKMSGYWSLTFPVTLEVSKFSVELLYRFVKGKLPIPDLENSSVHIYANGDIK